MRIWIFLTLSLSKGETAVPRVYPRRARKNSFNISPA
jgi:hypothetical protein